MDRQKLLAALLADETAGGAEKTNDAVSVSLATALHTPALRQLMASGQFNPDTDVVTEGPFYRAYGGGAPQTIKNLTQWIALGQDRPRNL